MYGRSLADDRTLQPNIKSPFVEMEGDRELVAIMNEHKKIALTIRAIIQIYVWPLIVSVYRSHLRS